MTVPVVIDESIPCSPEDESSSRNAGGRLIGKTTQFQKTRMCKFFLMEMCTKGDDCPFAHTETERKELPNLFRTRLCETLIQTGKCNNPNCTYAHSKDQLRATETYLKTKMCKFNLEGHCALGKKCRYAHHERELRQDGDDGQSEANTVGGGNGRNGTSRTFESDNVRGYNESIRSDGRSSRSNAKGQGKGNYQSGRGRGRGQGGQVAVQEEPDFYPASDQQEMSNDLIPKPGWKGKRNLPKGNHSPKNRKFSDRGGQEPKTGKGDALPSFWLEESDNLGSGTEPDMKDMGPNNGQQMYGTDPNMMPPQGMPPPYMMNMAMNMSPMHFAAMQGMQYGMMNANQEQAAAMMMAAAAAQGGGKGMMMPPPPPMPDGMGGNDEWAVYSFLPGYMPNPQQIMQQFPGGYVPNMGRGRGNTGGTSPNSMPMNGVDIPSGVYLHPHQGMWDHAGGPQGQQPIIASEISHSVTQSDNEPATNISQQQPPSANSGPQILIPGSSSTGVSSSQTAQQFGQRGRMVAQRADGNIVVMGEGGTLGMIPSMVTATPPDSQIQNPGSNTTNLQTLTEQQRRTLQSGFGSVFPRFDSMNIESQMVSGMEMLLGDPNLMQIPHSGISQGQPGSSHR